VGAWYTPPPFEALKRSCEIKKAIFEKFVMKIIYTVAIEEHITVFFYIASRRRCISTYGAFSYRAK
jgi:hypothetical protein